MYKKIHCKNNMVSLSSKNETVVLRIIYDLFKSTNTIYRVVEEKDIRKYSIDRERKRYRRVHGSQ